MVVAFNPYRFLERYEVGTELAKAVDGHRSSLVPCPAQPPQVGRGDAHMARVRTATSRYAWDGHVANVTGRGSTKGATIRLGLFVADLPVE